jgi:SSS family solute:Na+ symporter
VAYPALASALLPTGLLGIFALALMATIMSTVDSYAFLAASTFGYDIVGRIGRVANDKLIWFTRLGLIISAGLAVVLALFFRSVVDIWHLFGSIGTPALLLPVLLAFLSKRPLNRWYATSSISVCTVVTSVWYISSTLTASGEYWFSLEPIFPGLVLSGLIALTFYLSGSLSRA